MSETNVVEAQAVRIDESIDAERRAIVASLSTINAITCAEDIERARDYMVEAKRASKHVQEFFAPLVDAAHRAHKALTERRASLMDPIDDEVRRVQRLCDLWLSERRREQEAARRAAEDAARKAQEDAALAEAEMMEAAGLKNAASARLDIATSFPARVEVSPLPQKIDGVSVRTSWAYEVTDFAALPDMYKVANDPLIRAAVRTHKDRTDIPGVRVYPESKTAIRR